jgi:GH24 family phage-related lysozyme (muramidase)
MSPRGRIAVSALALSAAGLASLLNWEGFSSAPYIPTQGDVPTIGYGATVYEDGTPVRLTDPPITRPRAVELARRHISKDEEAFRESLGDARLWPEEYDIYIDFVYQFGIGNWRGSTMRWRVLAGDYRAACDALLMWRKQAGRDCSLPKNWGPGGCKGVWTRQQARHATCVQAQGKIP